MNGVYKVVLKSKDGRERETLAYLPTEEARQNYLAAARKRGIEVKLASFGEE